ncbi:MAG: hypothetical protein ACE5Q6_26005 [Dehalococcoidia bacterium]
MVKNGLAYKGLRLLDFDYKPLEFNRLVTERWLKSDVPLNIIPIKLSQRSGNIRSSLGTGVEIEAWDKGWTRAHEILTWEPLTDDFLVEVSFKLSAMISTLEPLLDARGPAS